MSGRESLIDHYVTEVVKVFGKYRVNMKQFTNCGVQYIQKDNGDIVLDQDVFIGARRPIMTSERTGAPAEQKGPNNFADMFVSLRGALAYTTLNQAWIQVYIAAPQRVQKPANLYVRRLNAVKRKLQRRAQKTVFLSMRCAGEIDLHTDSGYRGMRQVDDVKGYGMRGICLLRRGVKRDQTRQYIHLTASASRTG